MTDQSHVLEYTGLALLLLSFAVAVISMGLNTAAGLPVAKAHPQLARLINNKPLMLVTVVLGSALLLLSGWLPAPGNTVPASSGPNPTASSTSPAAETVASQAVGPQVVVLTPAQPAPAATPASAPGLPPPVPATEPLPTPPPRPLVTQAPEVKSVPSTKSYEPKVVPKAATVGTRCTRLLEKVGSGEPLSAAEKTEMVSTCQ